MGGSNSYTLKVFFFLMIEFRILKSSIFCLFCRNPVKEGRGVVQYFSFFFLNLYLTFCFISVRAFKSLGFLSICISHCYFLGIDKSWLKKPSTFCFEVIYAYKKVERTLRFPSPAFIACHS